MPTRRVKYSVNIRTDGPGSGDLPGFLDMLRYEGAQVVGWDRYTSPAGRSGFTVTLSADANQYQPDRWASFLIYPKVVE